MKLTHLPGADENKYDVNYNCSRLNYGFQIGNKKKTNTNVDKV